MQRYALIAIVLLACFGILNSLVLLDLEYTFLPGSTANGTAFCGPTGGCRTVNDSDYARILGLPNSLLGLVGYLSIIILALGGRHIAQLLTQSMRKRGLRSQVTVHQINLALAAIVCFGLIFSYYLLYVQRYIIGIYCPYCIISDVIMTAIAFCTYLVVRT